MANITDFLDPKDLSRLANHQVLARRVVEGFCSGLHRSPHKGFSVEFKQHRAYTPGDEIRRLTGKFLPKRTASMFGNMRKRPTSDVTCSSMPVVPCRTEVMMKPDLANLLTDRGLPHVGLSMSSPNRQCRSYHL